MKEDLTPKSPVAQSPLSQEDLKYARLDALSEKAWDIPVPSPRDTIIADHFGVRSALADRGIGFIIYSLNTFTYNALCPPAKVQTFNGERPTFTGDQEIVATYDLHPLHLCNAQLILGGVYVKTTWSPAGPTALRLSRLAYAQSFSNNRFELQGGYTGNDVQWVGYSVGGSLAGGSLGVNAIIPFELGLSYLPFMAPGVSLRYNAPKDWYIKAGIQRSTDPAGGDAAKRGDAVGLRFHRKGEGVLTIVEVGYKRPSTPNARSFWVRGGGIDNTSTYTNFATGLKEHNNEAVFFAADLQLTQPNPAAAYRGIYGGVSVHAAPSNLNVFSQYYEARLYGIGILPHRGSDLISLLVTDTEFSHSAQNGVVASGGTAFSNSTAITGEYSLHVAPGVYLDPGVSYVHHPDFSPRVPNALNLQVQLNLLF